MLAWTKHRFTVAATPAEWCNNEAVPFELDSNINPLLPALLMKDPVTVRSLSAPISKHAPELIVRLLHIAESTEVLICTVPVLITTSVEIIGTPPYNHLIYKSLKDNLDQIQVI